MVQQYRDKLSVKELCMWTMLSRSSFYHKPSNGKRGPKPSTATHKADGAIISNSAVVERIKTILSGEFVCYGYQKITIQLKQEQYNINHKKVYRLMNENNLLLGKVIRTKGGRKWVKHRRIHAVKPMEYLCLDIKYLWIEGEKRYYFLLTVLDVYSRRAIKWILQKSIRKVDVINLFREINLEYGIKGVNIRNDNGSQFIANDVRQFLRTAEANQEFTHVATPEENAYIEAYHSILETEVVQRFEFDGFYEAKLTVSAFVEFYNNRRIHGGIEYKTPIRKWNEYFENNDNFNLPDEAEPGYAGEQPERNNPANGNDTEGVYKNAPSPSKYGSFLLYMPKKTQNEDDSINSNFFEKTVQFTGG